MPEGDTLYRAAVTLQKWLAGREVTAATSAAMPMVGRTVDKVEANGKHLLVRFDSGHVLHTHLRMTGSWHVYSTGDRWQRPRRQARVSVTCGDRLAVCFNAPIVELLAPGGEAHHPSLSALGPDILDRPPDLDEIRRRARARPPSTPLGELLLDQRVAAGIGNIWRCEALFLEGHSPWAPVSAITDHQLDALMSTASRIMTAGLDGPAGRPPRWVYRRSGEGCRRCRTTILSRAQGEQARTAYWCPTCQPTG
ncbi:MAG TPA: DNA-formamidopyrimidine glycosylase family protein [Acidimicrobiales bacterium]|nr:DNA-formamidopyrimidine glycosylase family protein [Acidimicrobiales bacterium]